MKLTHLIKGTCALTLLASSTTLASAADVEVLHWWTAGGEAAAISVLKDDLATKGVNWKDMPIAGGSGTNAMTVLRARVTSGNAPTAAQMLGFDITDWASTTGKLANLNDIAQKEGWEAVIPAALQNFSKYEGNWIAAPVDVHSTNWVWINKKNLDAVGGKVPTTWEEFISVLDAMKEKGITPLAHGGQPWQDGTVFEAIVLGLGNDFYKEAFIDLNPEALKGPKMVEAFDRFTKLRSYVDDNFSGRDWNLASAMVIEGTAGMQMMGDWAKGEFVKAGQKPNEDFLCIRFPGTQGSVTFNSDQFVMFDQGDNTEQTDAQIKMASSVMSPKFQVAFNLVKGSVPARTDIPDTEFDACGKKGMADLAEANANGTLFGSMAHGYSVPASIKNAIYDVVTAQFNGEYDSATAAEELADAVADAK